MQTRVLITLLAAGAVGMYSQFASAQDTAVAAAPLPAVFSLKNLGFQNFDAQRDAADSILRSSHTLPGSPADTSRGVGVTILRWFTGGNSLLGDALSRRQVSE